MTVVTASGVTGTLTVGGGETTLTTLTNSGIFQLVVDTSAMAAGDELEIRIYSKLTAPTDTERLIYFFATANVQDNPLKTTIPIPSPVSYRVTLAMTSGTARAFPWAIWDASTGSANFVRTLTTLTLVNTSSSAQQNAPFITPMFGHPFKKGDIPSGRFPAFKQTDGTVCPVTMWEPIYWSDGSLKFAGFMLEVPTTSVAANGSIAIAISSDGIMPSGSGRTTADLTNANIVMNITGADNLSGAWTSSLSDLTEVVSYGDGGAGRIWRVRADFKQSGSPHKQMEGYHYIAAINDGNGNLAGFRYLPSVAQPWYNADTVNAAPTPSWRSFSTWNFQYGAGPTTVDLVGAYYSAKTFSAANAGNTVTLTAHSYDPGMPVRVSNSGGALPTGLSAGTTYFVNVVDANTISFYTGPMGAAAPGNGAGSVVTISGGSGTTTVTPIAYVQHFGRIFGATAKGTWRYLQAQGSVAADSTIRVQFNNAYIRSTKMVPSYNLGIGTVLSNSSVANFTPYGFGPFVRFIGQTGEREDIGLIPSAQARHFYTQAAIDEQAVRITGLAQVAAGTAIRDWTTKGLLNLSNPSNSYTNMPASLATTFEFRPSQPLAAAFTAPTGVPGSGGWLQGISTNTTDHMPNFSYYPYLVTGEPQFEDLVIEQGNLGLIGYPPSDRNKTIGATTYYGLTFSGRDTYRASAWASRNLLHAAGILPATVADGSQAGKYYQDLVTNLATYLIAWDAANSSFWNTAGFMVPQGNTNGRSSWQVGYTLQAFSHGQATNESANLLTWLQTRSNWPVTVKATLGNLYDLLGYYERSFHDEPTDSTYISSFSDWGAFNQAVLTWTSGTPGAFSWSTPTWTPANGDIINFGAATVPTGLSQNTPYYLVNTAGNAFNLSASPGGGALAVSNSSSLGVQTIWIQTQTNPATGGLADSVGPSAYGANNLGAYSMMIANGITGLSAVITEMQSRQASVNFTTDPKYAFGTSY